MTVLFGLAVLWWGGSCMGDAMEKDKRRLAEEKQRAVKVDPSMETIVKHSTSDEK